MLQVGTLMLLLRRPTRGTGVPLRGSRGRSLRAFADAGGLMSYGASIPEVVRQTGIHRGGNSSGDLPGAVAWPLAAKAQQAGKLPIIGLLGTSTASESTPFLQRLHELSWIEGRNIAVEGRWADGRVELYNEIAAELVRLKVDVIVTTGAGVPAAKQATSVIPIVFAAAVDPLGTGLVENLARPGRNGNGLSLQQTDIVGKRFEIMKEAIPVVHRVGLMANLSYPAARVEMHEVQALAGGVEHGSCISGSQTKRGHFGCGRSH